MDDSFQNESLVVKEAQRLQTVINTTMSPQKEETPSQNLTKKSNRTVSASFWDDQYMLQAVKLFERNDEIDNKQRQNVNEFASPLNIPSNVVAESIKRMNSTVVSDDILEMCQIFEKKNRLQSAKKAEYKPDKPRKRKSSIHFRTLFGSDDESDKENKIVNPELSEAVEQKCVIASFFKINYQIHYHKNLQIVIEKLNTN